MGERIMPLHPQEGKQGTNIDREKYEMIQDAILESTREPVVLARQRLSPEMKAPTS